ncbi:phosphatase PAP2 family protein [Candidatus Parcubacteria bacterium]|nr:phosphatase PAP2 family protein [Candidatus Parcubacteria bacterium]
MSRKHLILLGGISFFIFGLLAWSISSKIFIYSSIVSFDNAIQAFSQSHISKTAGQTMILFTSLADEQTIFLFLIAASLLFILVHDRAVAWLLIAGSAVGAGFSTLIKNLLLRPRPTGTFFDIAHRGFAYPSGHALMATIFYGFLGYALFHSVKNRKLKVIIALLTVLTVFCIGYSRVYLGVHWASDVIGGWLLGSIILIILILVFRHIHKKVKR